ncbi:hypothetical protein ABZP36_006794 [Zizania latifolia]
MIATAALSFVSSFHRPRLRPSFPRRASLLRWSASSSSTWEEREEARWLREEQRWLREEQRWILEESRWRAERESLLAEIAALRLRLGALEEGVGRRPLRPAIDALVSASTAPAPAVPEVPPPSRPVPVEEEVVVVEEKKATAKSGGVRRALRVGTKGEDVRAMQEALEKLDYYSGEEDMEFSSFSSGTERAVKTWQATVGISEDGVMTSDLLDILFTGKIGQDLKTNELLPNIQILLTMHTLTAQATSNL